MRHLRYLLPLLLALGLIAFGTTTGSAAPNNGAKSTATCKPGKTNGSKVCTTTTPPPPPPVTYQVVQFVGVQGDPGSLQTATVECAPGDTIVAGSGSFAPGDAEVEFVSDSYSATGYTVVLRVLVSNLTGGTVTITCTD